jgi:glutamyl-Q tRNA(Asp) synthetase
MPMLNANPPSAYVGRFAPSPSGPLHFGSLVTALGSFLQARKSQGKWLVRIEDIDPPREISGASVHILDTLEQHHLYWDDTPVYQSQRITLYQNKINDLVTKGLTFFCHCTRAQLASLAANNLCSCANKVLPAEGAAVRFKNSAEMVSFYDLVQQQVDSVVSDTQAQFAIKRKDGLFAYQLAVVVDDIAQGISEVVRGADLLHATFYQFALYKAFGATPPRFAHLPLVLSANGTKLSKQNHALAIDGQQVSLNLFNAMEFLGLMPPASLTKAIPRDMLNWAINAWDLAAVPRKMACNDNRIKALYSI